MPVFKRHQQATGGTTASPLLTRTPLEPGAFRESEIIGNHAVLRWDTGYGSVGLAYSLTSINGHTRGLVDSLFRRYGEHTSQWYSSVVTSGLKWGFDDAPELTAIDLLGDDHLSEPYHPRWHQLASVVGTRAPWWHPGLRDRDAILGWRPGAPPAIVPAWDVDMPTEALTALAAIEPTGSPAAQVCLWLAREGHYRATKEAQKHVAELGSASHKVSEWLTVGAVPAEPLRPAPDPLPEVVRRAGWAEILERRDTLAERVARFAYRWDGGADWPASAMTRIYPTKCQTAAEWVDRLQPAPTNLPPSVLERDLLRQVSEIHTSTLLSDTETGFPALHHVDHMGEVTVLTLAPQRLPTTASLHSVILSGDAVWIRTDDGRLWIAPEHPGNGLSWGYSGGGPMALAILLDRLLDDITARPVNGYDPKPPAGLEQLLEQTPQAGSTTYTRRQLEAARAGQ